MIDLHLVAAPLIGGVIGLITNGIAIKMLFRPLKPLKIGNFQLPFTPGLIPKEKPRIAQAIGKVVGANLLDVETLTKALTSDKLKSALNTKIDTVIENLREEERTVQEIVSGYGYEENLDKAVAYVGGNLGNYVAERLVENQVGSQLLEYAMKELVANLNPMFVMLAESAITKSQDAILDKIDEMILEQCPDMIDGYLEREYEAWIDKPVKEFAVYLWQHKESLKEKIWEFYQIILEKKSEGFIRRLDVASIVETKIMEFDEAELEKLILEISRKELSALVWIGGVLGALIGFVNLLF